MDSSLASLHMDSNDFGSTQLPKNYSEQSTEKQLCSKKNLYSQDFSTPKARRSNNPVKNQQFNLLSSNSSTLSTKSDNTDELKCPEKQFIFASIQIDQNDDFEQRIHDWLEKQNVIITDPYDKVADYYHNARTQVFNKYVDCLQISDVDSIDGMPIRKPIVRAQSSLVMSSSPIIKRRNKGIFTENRSDFGINHDLNRESKEVLISQFQHA